MSKNKSKYESGVLTTPKFRVSFPSLLQPSKMPDSPGELKYSVTMLFTPSEFSDADKARWAKLRSVLGEHFKHAFPEGLDEEGRMLEGYWNPMRRGETKPNREGYGRGTFFAKAANKVKPNIVNAGKTEIRPEALYAGSYARASISTYDYNNKSKGLGINLHNLMFISDGPAFGSTNVDIEDDFGDLTEDEMVFESPEESNSKEADPFGFD